MCRRENTATAGIVSGTERRIPGGGSSLAGLIQTDAPISPGQLQWSDNVEVTVLRDGRARTVEVELGRTAAG